MVEVKQKRHKEEVGDCFQACLASILNLNLDEIPLATTRERKTPSGWFWYLRRLEKEYLKDKGFYLCVLPIEIEYNGKDAWSPPGYAIMTITAKGGNRFHCVVVKDGIEVWDPAPIKQNLPVKSNYTVIIPLDPGTIKC